MLKDKLLLTYVKKEMNLPVIIIDEEEKVVFCNEKFNENFNIEKNMIGENINDYFKFENNDIFIRRDYILEKKSCSFTSKKGSEIYYSCIFIKDNNYCLVGFENYIINEEEVIKKLSKLNIDLSGMTRELAKKNNELKRANAEITRLLNTDFLTNILNRRAFYERLEERISLAERRNLSFGVILGDIDLFKKVNDTYGHDMGDIVLKGFANVLSDNIRGEDIVARVGGEEFCILASCGNIEELYIIAEKIRKKVCERHFEEIGKNITASFGIALYDEKDSLDDLIKRADLGLYKAKENGRNRVSAAD